jgi:hypothetical protein
MSKVAKPRNDAYVGLLAISFLALVGACALMALDANELGSVPAPFKVDVPGGTIGKAGEGLKRPETSGIPAPAEKKEEPKKEEPKKEEPKKEDPKKEDMSRAEPGRLPSLTLPAAPADVKPVSATDLPPLPVAPFELPGK